MPSIPGCGRTSSKAACETVGHPVPGTTCESSLSSSREAAPKRSCCCRSAHTTRFTERSVALWTCLGDICGRRTQFRTDISKVSQEFHPEFLGRESKWTHRAQKKATFLKQKAMERPYVSGASGLLILALIIAPIAVRQQANSRIISHSSTFAGKRAFGVKRGVKCGLAMCLFWADYSDWS